MSAQKIIDDIRPTAAPTESEIRRWNALPADEKRHRLTAAIQAGFAAEPSSQGIDNIIAEGRRRAATPDRG